MLGSASTQQLFASANSIAVIPQMWAEWNYNTFVTPHVTTSYNSLQILDSNFPTTASWSSAYNASVTQSVSGTGVVSIEDPNGTALIFTVGKKIENTDPVYSGLYSGKIQGGVKSNNITLTGTPGSFYKFTFYLKGNNTYTNGSPNIITSGSVTNVTNSGTTSVYYRVVGVGSNGETLGPDLINNTDIITASTNGTGSVTISWLSDTSAAAYRVYRSINKTSTAFRSTTFQTSFVDDLNACVSEAYANGNFIGHIFAVPSVNAYDSSGSLVNIVSYVKATDIINGGFSKITSAIETVPDVWKKVEVWFGLPSDNSTSSFSNVVLNMDIFADFEYAPLLFDNPLLHQITEHDYFLSDYYSTDGPFSQLRPGEAQLHPLLPTRDKVVGTNTTAPIVKPVSLVFKTPQVVFAKDYTRPFVQLLPSQYDKYNYYVSDTTQKSIQARYNQYLNVNKIVIKYNPAINYPSSAQLTIYTGSSYAATNIALPASAFNLTGITVLYYNGTSWSTTQWSGPPTLTASGGLQNVLTQVRGISLTSGSMSLTSGSNSNYFNPTSTDSVSNQDLQRLHIIELSPRLELDLSNILMNYKWKKDLNAPNSAGFPISYINTNSGTIEFSNIPFYDSNFFPLSVFENGSKNGNFYHLIRQGVKFTAMLTSPSFQPDLKEKIPVFVGYSEGWQVNDINSVTVDIFDGTKLAAQARESAQYSSVNGSLFEIITGMLNSGVFSDYDYDKLYQVCKLAEPTRNFWTDDNKTIFENLQDLLTLHQIGAYMDEYGILRFDSLKQYFNQLNQTNFNYSFAVTDKTTTAGTGSYTYIPNLVADSYKENVTDKIGQLRLRYKISGNSVSGDPSVANISSNNTYGQQVRTTGEVWKEDTDVALPAFGLGKSLMKADKVFYVNPNNMYSFTSNPNYWITNQEGELFIDDEIISYSGMEYVFYPKNNSDVYITKIIRNSSDIDDGIADVTDKVPTASAVDYHFTGNVVNVQRGKYGTPVSDHTVKTDADMSKYFKAYTYGIESKTAVATTMPAIDKSKSSISLSNKKSQQYKLLAAQQAGNNNYNLFSMTFAHSGNSPSNKKSKFDLSTGMFLNLNGTDATNIYFFEINRESNKGVISTTFRVYKGSKDQVLFTFPILNILDDNKYHRLNIYLNGSVMAIGLDGERIFTRDILEKIPTSSGTFGVFCHSKDAVGYNINVSEIYADCVEDSFGKQWSAIEYDIRAKYYFYSKQGLNHIVKNKPRKVKPFIFTVHSTARGLKVYDIKYSKPAIIPETAKLLPHVYGIPPIAGAAYQLEQVVPGDLMSSDLDTTPFSCRFAVVNNKNGVIFLTSKQQSSVTPLTILAKYQTLSNEFTTQRIVDQTFLNNVAELQTSWASSHDAIERSMNVLAKGFNTFYNSFDATVFGNPLVQIGDFAKFIYSLKRIGYDPTDPSILPVTCIVTNITQGFNAGVVNTELSLKPLITS